MSPSLAFRGSCSDRLTGGGTAIMILFRCREGDGGAADSAGNGGIIGPGDVQWMTAGGGILHEEYHAPGFAKSGGPFRMVQLWVNLPAKNKMVAGHYQAITSAEIPVVDLPGNAGKGRAIAGELLGARGPARTFTPVNVWDLRLTRDAALTLDLPEGHTAILVTLSGHVSIGDADRAGEAEMVLLSRGGGDVAIHADGEAVVLLLTGEPIDEPIAGHGPFVMNTEAEIRQAFDDFSSGRFVAAS